MAQWHCTIGGRQYGPVEEDVLRQWAREGRVRPTDSVWTEGWAEWVPAGNVPGLFDGAAPPPPPPAGRGATVGIAPPGGTGGRTPVTQLMSQGWQAMEGRWGIGIGFFLLFMLILWAAGTIGATIVVAGPFMLGQAVFILTLVRRGQPTVNMLFDGFKNFVPSLLAYLLMMAFSFAAMLCFLLVGVLIGLAVGAATVPEAGIVVGVLTGYLPGLVAATVVNLMLSQAFFLLADNSALSATDALRASRDMMRGNKLRLFGLQLLLGLIGLAAAMVTCLIGAVLLAPWFAAVQARFYEDLLPPRAEAAAQPALPAAPQA